MEFASHYSTVNSTRNFSPVSNLLVDVNKGEHECLFPFSIRLHNYTQKIFLLSYITVYFMLLTSKEILPLPENTYSSTTPLCTYPNVI